MALFDPPMLHKKRRSDRKVASSFLIAGWGENPFGVLSEESTIISGNGFESISAQITFICCFCRKLSYSRDQMVYSPDKV